MNARRGDDRRVALRQWQAADEVGAQDVGVDDGRAALAGLSRPDGGKNGLGVPGGQNHDRHLFTRRRWPRSRATQKRPDGQLSAPHTILLVVPAGPPSSQCLRPPPRMAERPTSSTSSSPDQTSRHRHPDIHSTHSVLTAEDVPRRPARTRRTAAPSSRSAAVRTWWSRADADAPPSGRGEQQRALCGSVRPRPRRTDAGGRARKGRSDLASGSVRIPRTSTASDMSWDVFGLLGTSRDECLLIACFSAP